MVSVLHNLYLRRGKLDSLHMCAWMLLQYLLLHFCRE